MAKYDYLLTFTEGVSEQLKGYITDCLRRANLQILREELRGKTLISVHAQFDALLNKAEELDLEKKKTGSSEAREVTVDQFDEFAGSDNKETFFTASERSYLTKNIVEDVSYEKEKLSSFGVSLRDAGSFLTECLHSKPPVLESAYPLHDLEFKEQLWRKMKANIILCPLQEIRDYYGEGVALYFAWMTCFTWTLVPVAVLGAMLYIFKPKGVTVDDNPLLPFYEVLMAFWAITFLVIWKRKESELAYKWNTYNIDHIEQVRPQFHGAIITSPITDKPIKYYPRWKRWLRYGLSVLLTLPVLLLAVGAMLCSLNLNGYIKDKESPVYIAVLTHFAQPGQIFAADSEYYGWMIPTIGHSLVINMLNKLYRTVAQFCTDMENHRTEREWNNSLIIKRVMFEVFDCFLPLFYIAFYQLNVVALRRELVGLFWGDEIRRLVTESFLPYLTEKSYIWKQQREYAKKKKNDTEKAGIPSQAQQDAILEEYDQFDDYLEMVVQFGYVTLFASAFPLAAAVSIVFLFIEARSDLFKLLFIYQKPPVMRVSSIGVWYSVLYMMMILSMLTNSLIVGFSSEQLASWCPWMYETIEGDQFIKPGYGRYVVAIVFSCEQMLILCAALVRVVVHDRPKWVRTAIARKNYQLEKERKALEKLQKQQAIPAYFEN
ncbi:anoctamin-8 [Nematostella vectensis]|uniref:anoctamin-8 n=1 Tax=Nematostella vectensis TaxID=45351 RepID=UPI002076F0B3|nr:anoctamin-8 [Nematostella vectensis]